MAKVITIAKNKGGVGKTTSAISLASIFADWGLRVALIDNDPQGNIGVYMGQDIFRLRHSMSDVYEGYDINKIGVRLDIQDILEKHLVTFKNENLMIFPSNHKLSDAVRDNGSIEELTQAVENIKDLFEIIIIDNGPNIGYLTKSALLSADMVLIPTEIGIGALIGISQLITEAESINRKYKKKVMVRVFVNDFKDTDHVDIKNLKKLKSLVGDKLYNAYVPTNTHLKLSKETGLPVILIERINKISSRGAKAFRGLAHSVLADLMPELMKKKEEESYGRAV